MEDIDDVKTIRAVEQWFNGIEDAILEIGERDERGTLLRRLTRCVSAGSLSVLAGALARWSVSVGSECPA